MLTTVGAKQLWVESDGDGPPVVFVHGLGSTGTSYEAQARALASSYRVVRFDLEGHGRSPLTGVPDIASCADDLGRILDLVPTATASIVGHSLGTLVAQHFAATRPDRVDKLILLGPLRGLSESTRQGAMARAAEVRVDGMRRLSCAIAAADTGSHTHLDRPELVGFVKELLLGQDPEAYALGCEALANSHDPDLSAFVAPTLLITGSEDAVSTPQQAQVLADSLQNSALEIVDGVGHWAALEAATAVSSLIDDFIREQGAFNPALHLSPMWPQLETP